MYCASANFYINHEGKHHLSTATHCSDYMKQSRYKKQTYPMLFLDMTLSIILGNPLAQVRVPQVVIQLQVSFLLWFCQESLRTIVNVLNEPWWKWTAQLGSDSYISQPVTHSYSTDVHNHLILWRFHPFHFWGNSTASHNGLPILEYYEQL